MTSVIKGVGVSALLLLAIGCFNTEPPTGLTTLSAWEGSLTPTSGLDDPEAPLITGNIAALVRQSGTEAGIGVREFDDPDLELDWRLYRGPCNDPGELVGVADDYAPLSASELEATAFLGQQLVQGAAYHVSVTDAASGDRLSCGNLSETDL